MARHCPKGCKAGSKVSDTRHLEDNSIRRYRRCFACGHTWHTWESMHQPQQARVIVRQDLADVRREVFQALKTGAANGQRSPT